HAAGCAHRPLQPRRLAPAAQGIAMSIDATLRLLAKARGLSASDIATAMGLPGAARAGVATVSAWLRGDRLPGSDQLDALARTFGVPASALLSELASTLDPARTK